MIQSLCYSLVTDQRIRAAGAERACWRPVPPDRVLYRWVSRLPAGDRGGLSRPGADRTLGAATSASLDSLLIAQVVKRYARRRVVAVCRRVAQGTLAQVEALLRQTQTTALIHTAYIERLIATFRARLCQTRKRHRYLNRQCESVGRPQRGEQVRAARYKRQGPGESPGPCRIKQPISLVEDGL